MSPLLADLVRKELREHLLALRVQMGFVLALVLVASSAFVLAARYEQQRAEAAQAARAEDDFVRSFAHLNRVAGVIQARRPPAPLMLVRGLPADAGMEALQVDPMRELFAPVDLTFVVGFLLSLLGIVLGFDAFTGEKERGTLRQVLANGLARSQVVVAKWVAGVVVLAVTLAMAALVAALVVAVRAGGAWTAAEWGAYALLVPVALLYCVLFFTLGLAASALSRASAVSVLLALFAWVVFVLVVPSLSPYVAAQVVKLPAVAALERDVQYITSEERDVVGQGLQDEVWGRHLELRATLRAIPEGSLASRLAGDPALGSAYAQVRREIDEAWARANREQQAKAARLLNDWKARSDRQVALSKALASASPLPSLTFALTELADTGFVSRERYDRQAAEYGRAFGEYARRRYAEERAQSPTLGVNDFLDLAGRPRFAYRSAAVGERLAAALPHIALLAAWTAVFLVTALAAFVRYDVR